MLSIVERETRPGCEVRDYSIRLHIKRPKADSEQTEGLDMLESLSGLSCWQNYYRSVSEEPIAVGLPQCLTPIAHLDLERPDDWFPAGYETRCGFDLAVPCRLPAYRDKVSNTVAVGRNLASYHDSILGRVTVQGTELCSVSLRESIREEALFSSPAVMMRQVAARFSEPQFRYSIRRRCFHREWCIAQSESQTLIRISDNSSFDQQGFQCEKRQAANDRSRKKSNPTLA
jgi:hypothetical protein